MRRMHFAWARGLGLWVLFQFFWAKVLLCSPGQPQVCSNSSSSASYILGLQVCVNMPASWKMGLKYSLFLFLFMRAGPYNGLAGKEKAVRIFGRRLQDEVADPRRCSSMVGWERRKEVTFIKQQMQTRCFIYSTKSQNQAVRLGLMVSSWR